MVRMVRHTKVPCWLAVARGYWYYLYRHCIQPMYPEYHHLMCLLSLTMIILDTLDIRH